MDGRFDVTRAGSLFGVAELSQNGLMQNINFSGTAPDNEKVYRLAAVCKGRYVMLGVPVPDRSGTLTLTKSFSKSLIRELGFDSPNAFELVLPDEKYTGAENNYYGSNDNEANNEREIESEEEPECNVVEPEPESEPKPEPESEPKPEPEPEIKPEPKPEIKPIPEFKTIVPEPVTAKEQNIQREDHSMQDQNPWVQIQEINRPQTNMNIPNPPEKPNFKEKINTAETKSGGWRPVANPSVMFAENGALSTANDIKGALVSEEEEFVYLAIPVSEDEPFPLMSAFCLGEPRTINNDEYLVFKLKNGAFTA